MASGGSSGSEDEEIGLQNAGEDSGAGEKASLVDRQEGEVHTLRSCLKARSFILALVISFLVIILVLVIIAVTTAIIVTSSSKDSGNGKPVISLDDVFNLDFKQLFYSGSWTPDGLLLQYSSQTGVTLLNPTDGSNTSLISASEWERLSNELGDIISVSLSHDQQYLLISTNYQKIYRHSFLADYYVYHDGDVSNVTRPDDLTGRLQYAAWSPTENIIAYVVNGSIFLFNVTSDDLTRVTPTSERVFHGIPDWVYEEEVLSSNFALWWAPSGQHLLYASFNDTPVRDFRFPHYGPPSNQYTSIESIAYPKPGTRNPNVTLSVVSVSNTSSTVVLQPPVDIDDDHYFIFAGWADETTPTVTWMNRTQTRAVYCTYDLSTSTCNSVYEQTSSAWIEILQEPMFSDDGSKFLALVSRSVGDDSFTHILEVPLSGEPSFLTNGEWEVTSIIGTDGEDTLYISTQTQPEHRHIYSTKAAAPCLTCSQEKWNVPKSTNPSLPERCDYFSASCDDDLHYCVLHCRGPAVPYSLLVEYVNEQFEPVNFLEENKKLHEAVSDLSLPTVDFFEISSTAEGYPSLNGRITYPPGYQSDRQYPVLVYVYGGPNSQVVDATCMLAGLSRLFLVSNLSLILVSVDGRGTGFRGDSFKHIVYRRLGTYETIDMLRTGRYLQQQPDIDDSKLAIYGASYGGYMAAMVGSSGSGVFSASISQSPVTDWHYYDSVYTERYMGQPTSEDNEKGYADGSVLPRVQNFSLVDFLLIHGTGDDNVHFQHTVQLVQALTNKEIQFRLQFYTDKTHALEGDDTRRHLYELQATFLRESFKLVV